MRASRWQRWAVVFAVAACGVLGWASLGQDAHAQSSTRYTKATPPVPVDDDRRAMRVDLRLRQQEVLADGSPTGIAAPGILLHLERRRDAGRWHLSLSLGSVDAPQVRTPRGLSALDQPYLVTRMEYDEDDGGPPVFYNAAGARVGVATDAQRRQLGLAAALRRTTWDADATAAKVPAAALSVGGRSPGAGLFADAAARDTRRQRLERQFGASAGRVRGLDRFVSASSDEVEEVLASPDSALPVEVNIARHGSLVSHLQFTYDTQAGVGYVRRLLRSEQVIDPASGVRTVSEVEASNFVLLDGGAQ